MRQISKTRPDARIKVKNKIFDLIPGATTSFYITFDDLLKREYIMVKIKAHKSLAIDKKMNLKPAIFFYKEVGEVKDGKDVIFKSQENGI